VSGNVWELSTELRIGFQASSHSLTDHSLLKALGLKTLSDDLSYEMATCVDKKLDRAWRITRVAYWLRMINAGKFSWTETGTLYAFPIQISWKEF
jgi:hypothetical protein